MSPISDLLGTSGFIEHLVADGRRIGEVVRIGPLDRAVPACPGWALIDLVHHLGYIHRWARIAAATAARPDGAQIDQPPSVEDLPADTARRVTAEWLDDGIDALVATLTRLHPTAPTWHPFTAPPVAALWPRRQAHETAVHRWDAESAVGATTPIDPLLAADGIAEYFDVIVRRLVQRDGRALPTGTLVVSCTDAGTRLAITSSGGADLTLSASPGGSVDAVLEADAESILLALWGRRPLPGPPADLLAREWLAVGGN